MGRCDRLELWRGQRHLAEEPSPDQVAAWLDGFEGTPRERQIARQVMLGRMLGPPR